ncbi:colicin-D, partial [Escherichia coli O121:H19 str. 2010C-3609]
MNKMAMIDLAKLFLASKITAIEFSERICVERRRLYGVKDLSPNILNCGEELFM